MATADTTTIIEVNVLGKVKKKIELPSSMRILEPGEDVPEGCDVIRLLHQDHGDIGQITDAKVRHHTFFNEQSD